jgi:hypothetical protein
LHPANRRLLQSEVAQQFPKASKSVAAVPGGFWSVLRTRWAYALAIVPVLGLLAFVLVPALFKNDNQRLALKGTSQVEELAAPAVETPADDLDAIHRVVTSAAVPREPDLAKVAPINPPAPATPTPQRVLVAADSSKEAAASDGAVAAKPLARQEVAEQFDAAAAEKITPNQSASVTTRSAAAPAPGSVLLAGRGEKKMSPGSGTVELEIAPTGTVVPSDSDARTDALASSQKKAEQPMPAGVVVSPKRFQSNLASINGTGEVAEGMTADQTFRARGGEEEREVAVLNSQAFTHIGADRSSPPHRFGQATKVPPPVLAKFKVQQKGRDLRVVDEDGSIYRGTVDEANTVYSQLATRQSQKAVTPDRRANLLPPKLNAANQNKPEPFYFYRVEGTNKTLNQNVVFSWNFVPTNEAVAATQLRYKDVLSETDPTKLPVQFPMLLQNSYINGRAQFGPSQELEVNAAPIKP